MARGQTRMPKKLSKRKSPHVPAQFLGYALQPTRLLDLALDAPPGSVLSLEVFEDVGVESATGEHLASQTKSALVKNPISDHALDLWKTSSKSIWRKSTTDRSLRVFTARRTKKKLRRRSGLPDTCCGAPRRNIGNQKRCKGQSKNSRIISSTPRTHTRLE